MCAKWIADAGGGREWLRALPQEHYTRCDGPGPAYTDSKRSGVGRGLSYTSIRLLPCGTWIRITGNIFTLSCLDSESATRDRTAKET